MNIELTEGETRHIVYALRSQLSGYIDVPDCSIDREVVQEHVKCLDTASALAKIDPKQFGPREIQKGDTVSIAHRNETGVVISRGRGRFAHRVAVETSDGNVFVINASNLTVIS